jgi:NSS family neurotransmitter:Na+ symporter
MIGRRARKNAVDSMRAVSPKGQPWWWIVGAMGMFSAVVIMFYYSEVAGWVFAYIFKSASGALLSTSPDVTSTAFGALVSDPTQSLIWQWIVLILVGGIILLGVTKGIERTTKTLMPVLFGLLVIVGIRSLTLPGASKGLEFLFRPDFTKITSSVLLAAVGLAFFKLSTGMGVMITYGSYYKDEQNIPATAIRVALADVLVSLLAGIAIFPAVFAFGFEPKSGASLLFITIPAVFASMPLGNIFMVIFFILAAIASIGAQLSLIEVPVSFIQEQFKWDRKKSTLVTILVVAVFGVSAALSNSTLANFKIFGLTPFDLFDFVTSNLMMPVTGLLMCVFVGWIWGYPEVKRALTNDGALKNEKLVHILFGIIKFVSPVLIVLVLLNGLKVI